MILPEYFILKAHQATFFISKLDRSRWYIQSSSGRRANMEVI